MAAGPGSELRQPRRAARAEHGGGGASCARRPRAARSKDGGGCRFRAARGADLRRAGMAAGGGSPSIVEFFGGEDGYRCGYCRSDTGNLSHGAGGAGWERGRPRLAEKRRGRGGRPGAAAEPPPVPAAQRELGTAPMGRCSRMSVTGQSSDFVLFSLFISGSGRCRGELSAGVVREIWLIASQDLCWA